MFEKGEPGIDSKLRGEPGLRGFEGSFQKELAKLEKPSDSLLVNSRVSVIANQALGIATTIYDFAVRSGDCPKLNSSAEAFSGLAHVLREMSSDSPVRDYSLLGAFLSWSELSLQAVLREFGSDVDGRLERRNFLKLTLSHANVRAGLIDDKEFNEVMAPVRAKLVSSGCAPEDFIEALADTTRAFV